jgi:prophage regulatory protein
MKHAERLIRLPEVKTLTGWSRSSIYAGIAAGTFPRPIKLGSRAVAWPETSIQEWIEARIRDSRTGKAA